MWRAFTLSILPQFHLYVDWRGMARPHPSLTTMPRLPLMPDKLVVMKDMLESGHYGLVRDLNPEYKAWLLGHFSPWAATWLSLSIYMWWAETFTETGGGGGSLPWTRSMITSDNRSAEDELHEIGHFWEFAKVTEGLWTPRSFTETWKLCVDAWPQAEDRVWAKAFVDDPLGVSAEAVNETYASTVSRIMGDKNRLPLGLVSYYEALFS